MPEPLDQRRLAAIMVADVVGYSRMMAADEAGTFAALKTRRETVLVPTISAHRGRIVKLMGDGVLVEFSSVINAVNAALEIQRNMAETNEPLSSEKKVALRIGINSGDVIGEDSDVYGDGVNIAARLETMAHPGGICISGKVHDEVAGKVDCTFSDLGTVELKNIAKPVRAYRVEKLQIAAPASQTMPLPDKPSIAVLPFQNMSGDQEQEYFADGIVEEIITALSQFRQLFVIARNTTFTYKGRAIDIKQVGRELGVRYVLEGSIRKAANRVRITGQLIDTATGSHLWADRFDGSLEDVFDLQDQVTINVVGAIAPKVERAEIERSRRKPTGSLDAYDHYLRGLSATHQWTKDAVAEALTHFRQATELDPKFAAGYGWAARCYSQRKSIGLYIHADEIAECEKLARKAAELGWDDAVALATAGIAFAYVVGNLEEAAALTDRAIALNPNLVWAWHFSGWVKLWSGEPEAAIERFKRAIRMSPKDAKMFDMQDAMASAYFVIGDYRQALSCAKAAVREKPFTFSYCIAAASAALTDQLDEGKRIISVLRQLEPDLRIDTLKELFTELRKPEDFERLAEGLRRAGLPE
jgi:TolB-like protein